MPRSLNSPSKHPSRQSIRPKLEANIASIKGGGQGNNLMSKCVPPGMPRMMLAYNQFEFVIFPDTTYIVQEHFGELRGSIPTVGPGHQTSSRHFQVIPLVSGSMRMATAATMHSASRRAASQARAPSTTKAYRSMRTTRPLLQSTFTLTPIIPMSCATKSPPSIIPCDTLGQ
jgi:hypothetical protein